jgi:two-component system LytT family sensor kinase
MNYKYKVWLHLAFWLLFSTVPRLISPPAFQIGLLFMVTLVIDVCNFYAFYVFVIPDFFIKRKIGKPILIGAVLFVGFILLRIGISDYFSNFNEIIYNQKSRSPILFVLKEVISSMLFVVYPLLLTFTIRYFQVQKVKLELVEQKKESELSLLRSQINPHFFFNTLNNIYALIYSGSPDAHLSVLKLSELMRYTLYKKNSEKIPLMEEIDYLKNYIELEMLRFTDKDFVRADISCQSQDLEISHMLLIPFIENAFKHCDKDASSPAIIIRIHLQAHVLAFYVRNEKDISSGHQASDESGIGLANVRKRLELLYARKYQMEILDEDSTYTVNLKLQLT